MFFMIISGLRVSGGFSAHHQELIKLYVQPWGIVMLSCCLSLVWLGSKMILCDPKHVGVIFNFLIFCLLNFYTM